MEINFENITKPILKNYDLSNPWKGTKWEELTEVNIKTRGTICEKIAAKILEELKYNTKSSVNFGHDIITENKKTEIKFSLATKRNYNNEFTFNHIGFKKDWDQIIFCGVNGDLSLKMVLFEKDNLPKELFTHQQGGKNSSNDDFMCIGENSSKLMNHEKGKLILYLNEF